MITRKDLVNILNSGFCRLASEAVMGGSTPPEDANKERMTTTMTKVLPYPADGGLKAAVRAYGDTPSAFAVVAKHFGMPYTPRQQSQRT